MNKPVWRMNRCAGVPSDWSPRAAVMYFNGATQNGYENYTWSLDHDDCYPIHAYQTTRTKAAKYESVECEVCGGFSTWLDNSGWNKCKNCNGKGYRLERVE